jgi:hypothetical protein
LPSKLSYCWEVVFMGSHGTGVSQNRLSGNT